jgi:hypothetical protein
MWMGVISPFIPLQKQMYQVKLKGTVVNALTTLAGMIIVLMDCDGNLIYVHTSSVRVCFEWVCQS